MFVTLTPQASPEEVAATLRGLGLWVRRLGTPGGCDALQVQPGSTALAPERLAAVPGVLRVHAPPSAHPRVDAQAGAPVAVAGVLVGEAPVLIAGPCSAESPEQVWAAAEIAAGAGAKILRGGAFKPRTSPYSFAGHGRPALRWLRDAADAFGMALVTEVTSEAEVSAIAALADWMQIGSRSMQSFALLRAVGQVQRPVLLKRGVGASVEEWLLAAEHLLVAGAPGVVFCERGVRGFDDCARNLLDLGGVALLKHVYRQPVIVDPSHAVGRRDLIGPLAAAALAAGADGVMVEVHPRPAEARCDGPQALDAPGLNELAGRLGLGR